MNTPFIPYWLIHEQGKDHGFAVVDLDSAITEEHAIRVWRETTEPRWLVEQIDQQCTVQARLITEPFVS